MMNIRKEEKSNPNINFDKKKCKLCGGESDYQFSVPLNNQMVGQYYLCSNCYTLQSYHLDNLSNKERNKVYDQTNSLNLDSGAAWRQYCIINRLQLLVKLKILPSFREEKILDFGCGSGFIVGYFRHKLHWNIYGYEPYAKASYLPNFILRNINEVNDNGPYTLIIASETFEHFIHPRQEIQRINDLLSKPKAFLYVTTGLFQKGKCDRTWDYLAPQSGQHVTFFSKISMKKVSDIIDSKPPYNVGAEYEWLFVRDYSNINHILRLLLTKLICLGVKINLLEKIT